MRRVTSLGFGFAMLAAACGGESVRTPVEVSNLPDAHLMTVQVRATDYNFELAQSRFESGLLQFEVTNVGSMPHELMVVPVDGDRLGLPVAHIELAPSERQYLRIDLPPGKYEFTCVLQTRTANGLASHLSLGMAKVVEVDG